MQEVGTLLTPSSLISRQYSRSVVSTCNKTETAHYTASTHEMAVGVTECPVRVECRETNISPTVYVFSADFPAVGVGN